MRGSEAALARGESHVAFAGFGSAVGDGAGTCFIGNYRVGRTIGEGTFGKVKLATHLLTGLEVAIKIVDKSYAPLVAREVETWRHLRHPNIAQLYEVLVSDTKIYMVTEYASGGEVFDYIVTQGRMKEKEARVIFRQLVVALGFCHARKFVHRDLKLENVLLDANKNVKVIDFGFTRNVDGKRLLETYCGSVAYAAPEMILAQKYSGPEADIWSLGVILYTLLCGYLPFDDDNETRVHAKIVAVEYEFPDFISESAKSLISSLLRSDPAQRLSISEILAHSWFLESSQTDLLANVTKGAAATATSNANVKEFAEVFDGTSSGEKETMELLMKLGFDTDLIKKSVSSFTCDSFSATYFLLLKKQTLMVEEEQRKREMAAAVTSASESGKRYIPGIGFVKRPETPNSKAGHNNNNNSSNSSGGKNSLHIHVSKENKPAYQPLANRVTFRDDDEKPEIKPVDFTSFDSTGEVNPAAKRGGMTISTVGAHGKLTPAPLDGRRLKPRTGGNAAGMSGSGQAPPAAPAADRRESFSSGNRRYVLGGGANSAGLGKTGNFPNMPAFNAGRFGSDASNARGEPGRNSRRASAEPAMLSMFSSGSAKVVVETTASPSSFRVNTSIAGPGANVSSNTTNSNIAPGRRKNQMTISEEDEEELEESLADPTIAVLRSPLISPRDNMEATSDRISILTAVSAKVATAESHPAVPSTLLPSDIGIINDDEAAEDDADLSNGPGRDSLTTKRDRNQSKPSSNPGEERQHQHQQQQQQYQQQRSQQHQQTSTLGVELDPSPNNKVASPDHNNNLHSEYDLYSESIDEASSSPRKLRSLPAIRVSVDETSSILPAPSVRGSFFEGGHDIFPGSDSPPVVSPASVFNDGDESQVASPFFDEISLSSSADPYSMVTARSSISSHIDSSHRQGSRLSSTVEERQSDITRYNYGTSVPELQSDSPLRETEDEDAFLSPSMLTSSTSKKHFMKHVDSRSMPNPSTLAASEEEDENEDVFYDNDNSSDADASGALRLSPAASNQFYSTLLQPSEAPAKSTMPTLAGSAFHSRTGTANSAVATIASTSSGASSANMATGLFSAGSSAYVDVSFSQVTSAVMIVTSTNAKSPSSSSNSSSSPSSSFGHVSSSSSPSVDSHKDHRANGTKWSTSTKHSSGSVHGATNSSAAGGNSSSSSNNNNNNINYNNNDGNAVAAPNQASAGGGGFKKISGEAIYNLFKKKSHALVNPHARSHSANVSLQSTSSSSSTSPASSGDKPDSLLLTSTTATDNVRPSLPKAATAHLGMLGLRSQFDENSMTVNDVQADLLASYHSDHATSADGLSRSEPPLSSETGGAFSSSVAGGSDLTSAASPPPLPTSHTAFHDSSGISVSTLPPGGDRSTKSPRWMTAQGHNQGTATLNNIIPTGRNPSSPAVLQHPSGDDRGSGNANAAGDLGEAPERNRAHSLAHENEENIVNFAAMDTAVSADASSFNANPTSTSVSAKATSPTSPGAHESDHARSPATVSFFPSAATSFFRGKRDRRRVSLDGVSTSAMLAAFNGSRKKKDGAALSALPQGTDRGGEKDHSAVYHLPQPMKSAPQLKVAFEGSAADENHDESAIGTSSSSTSAQNSAASSSSSSSNVGKTNTNSSFLLSWAQGSTAGKGSTAGAMPGSGDSSRPTATDAHPSESEPTRSAFSDTMRLGSSSMMDLGILGSSPGNVLDDWISVVNTDLVDSEIDQGVGGSNFVDKTGSIGSSLVGGAGAANRLNSGNNNSSSSNRASPSSSPSKKQRQQQQQQSDQLWPSFSSSSSSSWSSSTASRLTGLRGTGDSAKAATRQQQIASHQRPAPLGLSVRNRHEFSPPDFPSSPIESEESDASLSISLALPAAVIATTSDGTVSHADIDEIATSTMMASPPSSSSSSSSSGVRNAENDNDNLRKIKTFSIFNVSTTSSKSARVLAEEVRAALETLKIKFKHTDFQFECLADHDSEFRPKRSGPSGKRFFGSSKQTRSDWKPIRFELEICRLQRMDLNCVRLKRLGGDSWDYKDLCDLLLTTLHL